MAPVVDAAPVIDVDSHVYEPVAVWDDYVPADMRAVARSAFFHEVDSDGNRVTVLNGSVGPELNRSRLVRQAIWRPGMTPNDIGQLDPDVFQPLTPGAADPVARLSDMDAMGVDAAVVFPTLFAEYLPLVDDPDAAAVLARAYNDWVWDFAARGRGRLHPVALIPMQAATSALEELDRAAEKGFTSVMIRPAFHRAGPDPGPGIFVEDVPYRPVWRRIEELGVAACVHPMLGITGPDAVSSGGFAERVSHRLGATHTIAEPIAYMQDADLFMTAALFHGLLEDHPDLRLAVVHSGASWVPLALEKCETYLWLSPQFGHANVCLEPEEVWDRHPALVSFDGWERPVGRMPDRVGAKAAWGSRYPHHDTSTPAEARAMLESEGLGPEAIDVLLGGRAAEFFGLEVPATV